MHKNLHKKFNFTIFVAERNSQLATKLILKAFQQTKCNMQSKEIKDNETRTFKEICEQISTNERSALSRNIITDLRVRERTVMYWMAGKKPISWSQQRDIARIIKTFFNISTPVATLAETLFN